MLRLLALLLLFPLAAAAPTREKPADLVIDRARVWTGDASRPWAEAVAIRGERIVAVGRSQDIDRFRGPGTRWVDLSGRLLVPGFIDGHTHFETATDWFYEARLYDVDDQAMMLQRLREAVARVPAEFWITALDWGGGTARRRWSKGERDYKAFEPSLAAVDEIAPDRPIMLQRHDGAVFVNSKGLRLLRLTNERADPSGGAMGRAFPTGALNGMLYGTAAFLAWTSLPPKSRAQTQVAARALMKQLNAVGITGIHDIARIDALSQQTVYPVFVERSHSNMQIFEDLRASGDLTVRVHGLLPLRNFHKLKEVGITAHSGDELIHFGGLKAFIDGYMTSDPWRNRPQYRGDFTMRVVDEGTMRSDVAAADRAGFDIAMHAFGDRAHRLMLEWYEAAAATNPPRDRRFRLVHAWWPALSEIQRAGRFHAVADITPTHMLDGRSQAEAILSLQLQRTAFAWRTLLENGVRLNLVSDLPGSYDRSDTATIAPLTNMYYAVTRRRSDEPASAAWAPEQALTIDEALTAYTINPAWTAREDEIKGSISVGKLADLVVISEDVTKGPPERLLSASVLWTLLAGKTVAGGPPSDGTR